MTKKEKHKKHLLRATKEEDGAIRKVLTMMFWRKRGVPDYHDYEIWHIMYYGKLRFLYYKTRAKLTRRNFEILSDKTDEYYRWLG